MTVDRAVCAVAERLLLCALCAAFALRDAAFVLRDAAFALKDAAFALRDTAQWTSQELGRALQRWQRAAHGGSEGSAVASSRRRGARCRPRPRHQRLAWHLWRQLQRRLCRRQAARQRRRQAHIDQQTRLVWGNCSPPPWPLSLTSDYHSDGRETPAPTRSDPNPPPPPPPADNSLSSAYSWDVQPSPRSLPSSPPQEQEEEEEEDSPQVRCERSDGSSSWSSVHESDCECELRPTTRLVGSVGQGARRKLVVERACRQRRTHAQEARHVRRQTRRYSELLWARDSRYRYDGCRSSEDEMDAERGPLSAGFHQLKTPMSFSLSSLQSAGFHTPSTAELRLRADRPYNSLCRKRKERSTADPSHRRSWGSDVSKDSFWEAIQPSYAFLMEDQLIESCKEASGDLTWDATDVPGMDSTWSFHEFMDQYNELYQWLTEIQTVIYSSPKNITDRRLRESHMEEIQRRSYRRTLLVDQGCRLQRRQPKLRDEVQWHVAHLSSKWDALLQCVRPPSPPPADPDIADVEPVIAHEVLCLKQWFSHMDSQLGPISFRLDLRSTQEAAERLKQYQALHEEVKSQQRIVSGVCRLCTQRAEEGGGRRLVRLAEELDTSWQQIFLRAYEWTCHLEGLLEQFKQGILPRVEDGYSADEDEQEPLSKVRRLASCDEATSTHSDAGSFIEDDYLPSESAMKVLEASPASVPTSPAKKLEREILDKGYSSENSGQSSDSSDGAGGPLSSGVRRAAVNTSNVRLEVVTAGGSVSDDADRCHGDGVAERPPGGSTVGSEGATGTDGEPFSSPQRPADNCGTFYFRHSDTESERAPRGRRYDPSSSDLEYLSPAWPESDSDWLNNSGLDDSDLDQLEYATAAGILSELGEHEGTAVATDAEPAAGAAEAQDTRLPPPPPPCDSEIHRLVERAESLVRADLRRSLPPLELDRQVKAKGRRVREWLKKQHGRRACDPAAAAAAVAAAAAAAAGPVDISGQVTDSSCDASGEYTTGESDGEQSASSVSEDLTCSMVTCHELGTPTAAAPLPAGSPLDTPTTPKVVLRSKKRRSGERPWSLHGLTSGGRLRTAPLSVSETALNEMLTPTNEKGVTSSSSNTTVSAGAIPKTLPNSASFDSPFWSSRRRCRPHRASAARSSGSDGAGSSPTHRRRRSLRSSGSDGERARTGLAAAESHRSSLLSCATEATLVEMSPRTVSEASPRDPPEEASSVSEQAWDPYQELKEVTELGSEGSVDPDTVRRLLDCDDYRKFIDSHSDCASSSQVSSARGQIRSPARRNRRKPRALTDSLDSDSDIDELRSIPAESRAHLAVVQAELERRAADADATYSSILATCRSELSRLEQLRTLVDPLGLGRDPSSPCYKPEVIEIADVIQRWELLRAAAMERQRSADTLMVLQERLRSFRHALLGLDERATRASARVDYVDELQARVSALQALQAELADRRRELVTVNTDVHGFVTSGGAASLKEDVATLYRLWDEVNHRTRSQLERLGSLQTTWRQFQKTHADLTAVLEGDRLKLGLIRETLMTGGDVGSRVQDVARVLTERPSRPQADAAGSAAADSEGDAAAVSAAEEHKAALLTSPLSSAAVDDLSEGTSGYDSACSDDLSERERRLGRLRRMARDLEALVSPASPAWNDIETTLSSATSQLRDLQESCRDLVIKTTGQYQPVDDDDCSAAASLRGKSGSPSRREFGAGSGRRGWLWRVLRAALPIQLALMLCFCVACLLEPHCCDNLNNLSMSLTPQLRYLRGPPPI